MRSQACVRGGVKMPAVAGFLIALSLAGCDFASNDRSVNVDADECSIPTGQLASGGVPKDAIPALTDPDLVPAEAATYLSDDDRVIGLRIGGHRIAVPHNILWSHEIANFNLPGAQLAVTYCPLTGSSMAFDRSAVGGGEFGVSGLLFQNNLTMYDRTSQESLWPQMNRQAGCGPRDGTPLPMVPVLETTWAGWRALFPDTEVISNRTGFSRNYTSSGYPYGDYENLNNRRLLFSMSIDERRPPKERVLGIPSGNGGIAFPFGTLDEGAPVRVVSETVDGQPVVVFWDRAKRAAMAYTPETDAGPLTFVVQGGRIVDTATSSAWTVDGRAFEGPLSGTQLTPVKQAYVAFWFAWAAFQPETRLWEAGAP